MYKYFFFILLIFYLFSCTPPCNILEPREGCNITLSWEGRFHSYTVNTENYLRITINNEDNISHENITVVTYFPNYIKFFSSSLPILFYKKEKQSSIAWKIDKIGPLKSVDIEMGIKAEEPNGRSVAFNNFIQIFKNNAPVYIEEKYIPFYGIYKMIDINFYDIEDPCEIGTPTTYYIGIKKNEFIHTPITNFSFGIYIPESMVISSIKSPSQYTIENHIIKFVPVERLDYQEMKHEITCIPTLPGIVTTEIYMKYDEQTDKDYKTSVEYTTVYDPVTQIKKPTCYSGWHPLPKP